MKLCLRAETKPFEKRRALSPSDVSQLVNRNIHVVVEACKQSIFSAALYAEAGAEIVEKGRWKSLSLDYIILGLKELEESQDPLVHTHVFFAHCYKYQAGWAELLNRFNRGGGSLLDLEYLVENNRRIAAFGYWAGYAGAAMTWALWQSQQQGKLSEFEMPYSFNNVQALLIHLKDHFSKNPMKAIIIGASGRSGKGASDFFRAVNNPAILWDLPETSKGGPFAELLEYDALVNCVLMSKPNPPFLSLELLKQNKRLAMIGDVSCDPTGPYNSLPVYSKVTTFDEPLCSIGESKHDLYVMAIDHLPTLLPKESSEDFSSQLLPYLFDMTGSAWKHAMQLFNKYSFEALKQI